MKRHFPFLLAASLILLTKGLYGEEVQVLEKNDVIVLFAPPLGVVSGEVAGSFARIKGEIEKTLGWDLAVRPTVFLTNDSRSFHSMAESPFTVAFAVPSRGLIVVDYGKIKGQPFTLEGTLRHEICHLLLHEHVTGPILPRWLDEGVCQWASGGVVDIVMDQKRSLLNRAALRDRFIPLDSLKEGFPGDKDSLLLAYEESEGFVKHIIARSGREGILSVLEHMKRGEEVDTAIRGSLSVPLERLEKEWQRSLRRKMTWFTYLSYHLYEILFALAALTSLYAFIRAVVRKRAYMKGDGG